MLVNWLTGANQAADRRTSSCCQVLIKWVKAQHEGALPPPCIVRKDPRAQGPSSLVEEPLEGAGPLAQARAASRPGLGAIAPVSPACWEPGFQAWA